MRAELRENEKKGEGGKMVKQIPGTSLQTEQWSLKYSTIEDPALRQKESTPTKIDTKY